MLGGVVQNELNGKDDTVRDLRLWLNQAQGQLQNTQAALHEREADCKTLAADLKVALTDMAALKVHTYASVSVLSNCNCPPALIAVLVFALIAAWWSAHTMLVVLKL